MAQKTKPATKQDIKSGLLENVLQFSGGSQSAFDSPQEGGLQSPPVPNFPVVGIGASAGGLAVFESFLSVRSQFTGIMKWKRLL